MSYLLILLMGFFDRLRGDAFHLIHRTVEKLTYGWIVAALAGYPLDFFTVGIAGLWAVGMSFGWGEPLGAFLERREMSIVRLEWWQRGILEKDTLLAIVARGALWGLCITPLAFFDLDLLVIAVAITIAFTLSVFIARFFIVLNNRSWYQLKGSSWEATEYLRGWIAGLIIYGVNYV